MWEIDDTAWDEVRDTVLAVLKDVGRRRMTISYGDLVARVGGEKGQRFDRPNSSALTRMLGQINSAEPIYHNEPLMISAVVVHVDDRNPGSGSFVAAEELGFAVPKDGIEQRNFWAQQLERVWGAYGKDSDGR